MQGAELQGSGRAGARRVTRGKASAAATFGRCHLQCQSMAMAAVSLPHPAPRCPTPPCPPLQDCLLHAGVRHWPVPGCGGLLLPAPPAGRAGHVPGPHRGAPQREAWGLSLCPILGWQGLGLLGLLGVARLAHWLSCEGLQQRWITWRRPALSCAAYAVRAGIPTIEAHCTIHSDAPRLHQVASCSSCCLCRAWMCAMQALLPTTSHPSICPRHVPACRPGHGTRLPIRPPARLPD